MEQVWGAALGSLRSFEEQLLPAALNGEHLWGIALERYFGEQLSVATLGSSFREPLWRIALGNSFGKQLWTTFRNSFEEHLL